MKRLRSTATLLLAAFAFSCNQADDPAPTPTPDPDPVPAANCRIVSGQAETVPLTFSYNGDKKLTTYEEGGSAPQRKTFTYASGLIVGVQSENGTDTHRDSIFINSAGYVTRFSVVALPAGTLQSTTTYTLDANNQVTAVVYKEPAFPASTTTVEYNSAGDMVKQTRAGSTTTYDYYTDKSVRAGDFLHLSDLSILGSARVFKTAHLLKSTTSGSGAVTGYAYEFDAAGRITKVTITEGSSTRIITLQQSCD